MASASWEDVAIRAQVVPYIQNRLFDEMPEMKWLQSKGKVKPFKSNSLSWLVELNKDTSHGSFSGLSPVSRLPHQPNVAASLSLARFYATITVAKDEELINKAAGIGVEKYVDLITQQTKVVMESFREYILQNGVYGTSTTTSAGYPNIIGFPTAVDSATSYAGISRTTYSRWQSYEESTTITQNTLMDKTTLATYLPHIMRTAWRSCDRGGTPDAIFTTDTLATLYEDLNEEHQAINNVKTADIGYADYFFKGKVPIVASKYCTAGEMYFLNSADWEFFIVPEANFEPVIENGSMWQALEGAIGKYATLLFMGQLKCSDPIRQGKLTNKGLT
jgi:hypothetical protein